MRHYQTQTVLSQAKRLKPMRTIEDVAEEKLSHAPYISFVTKSTLEEEQV